jgi:hypothetical protein
MGFLPNICFSTTYQLEENEWLFVMGQEFRSMELSVTDEGHLMVNNVIVLKEPSTRTPEFLGLTKADTVYSRVPFIVDNIQSGEGSQGAINRYKTIVQSHFEFALDQSRLLAQKEISLQQAQANFLQRRQRPDFESCMELLSIGEDGTISWMPKSAKHEIGAVWMPPVPKINPVPNTKVSLENYFPSSEKPQLLVIGYGNYGTYTGKENVEQRVSQLKTTILNQNYQEGEFSKRYLKNKGFLLKGRRSD